MPCSPVATQPRRCYVALIFCDQTLSVSVGFRRDPYCMTFVIRADFPSQIFADLTLTQSNTRTQTSIDMTERQGRALRLRVPGL